MSAIEPKEFSQPTSKLWERVNATTIRVILKSQNGVREGSHQGRQSGTVLVERAGRYLFVDGMQVCLFTTDEQRRLDSHEISDLRKQLLQKEVLHPNVLDACIEADMLPESWKMDAAGDSDFICFWGVVFQTDEGALFVRCVQWHDHKKEWVRRNLYLKNLPTVGMRYPAAVVVKP